MQQRSIHPSLRIGEQSAVATNDTTGTMAFLRSHATDTTYFILNRGSDAVTYEVPASMTALIAATDPEQTDFDVASASVMIPARAAVLLANQIP
jgi:pullulanase/glycogen debranching enzyme